MEEKRLYILVIMENVESEMESPNPSQWDVIVATNREQRKLHAINPLINTRLVVGKKFPIPAQFIFELLQNADDAEAKNVILTFENEEFKCGKKFFFPNHLNADKHQ
jgi:hypothetical protein